MVDNELLEKKLTFERLYNFGRKINVENFLEKNPELPDFLIKNYEKIFKEFEGNHSGYYFPVQTKLMFLQNFKNGN